MYSEVALLTLKAYISVEYAFWLAAPNFRPKAQVTTCAICIINDLHGAIYAKCIAYHQQFMGSSDLQTSTSHKTVCGPPVSCVENASRLLLIRLG